MAPLAESTPVARMIGPEPAARAAWTMAAEAIGDDLADDRICSYAVCTLTLHTHTSLTPHTYKQIYNYTQILRSRPSLLLEITGVIKIP